MIGFYCCFMKFTLISKALYFYFKCCLNLRIWYFLVITSKIEHFSGCSQIFQLAKNFGQTPLKRLNNEKLTIRRGTQRNTPAVSQYVRYIKHFFLIVWSLFLSFVEHWKNASECSFSKQTKFMALIFYCYLDYLPYI